MDKKYLTNVMTYGEAAMQAINQYKFGKKFFIKAIAITLKFKYYKFKHKKLL